MSAATHAALLAWTRAALSRPVVPPALAADAVDWTEFARLAETNRVAPLLFRALKEAPGGTAAPPETLAALRAAYLRSLAVATHMGAELAAVAGVFRRRGVRLVVLRGLALGDRLYGDSALRPFTDVDLLVARDDLPRARECMEAAGCALAGDGPAARHLERYHLHLGYRHRSSGALFELHWALDHRYTPFAIPYPELLAAARETEAAGARFLTLAPSHDFLANAVHAAKHAWFLPFVEDSAELRRRLLAEGSLIHLCDLVRAAAIRDACPDWPALVTEARDWNVARELAAVLRALHRLWPGAVPDEPRLALGEPRVGVGERLVVRALDPDRNRERSLLTRLRPGTIFRPIRALDLLRYLAPGRAYLRHRYGCRTALGAALRAALHPFVAAGELTGNALAWRRASTLASGSCRAGGTARRAP
jgi:hypothetical protein